ncbi:HK97 family phage prohead protease [Paenirhodobacter enshiensis]|uniref:HK97 family phage prohead protease n=1 Tax=Paenirhodobacter enshiensis TaxID=1105367 RepID=UPI0035AE51F5
MNLEFKLAGLDEATVTEEGTFSGYASRFGIVDQGGDVVEPGAYTKSLASGRAPAMLWQHNPDIPIGIWTAVKEDATGLRVEGKLDLNTVKGSEAHSLLKMGAIKGLSIGYRTREAEQIGNERHLKEVDLWEISLVTFPMQAEAGVDAVKGIEAAMLASKSGDFAPLKKSVEDALRDAGFPVWLRKAVAARAPDALGDGQRDASASETAKAINAAFKF